MTRIACGKTRPGQWRRHNPRRNEGLFVDVDTRLAGFSMVPVYVSSLCGHHGHWNTVGGGSVCQPTAHGFRVYIRYVDGSPITPGVAIQGGWHIQWIGFEE